MGKERDNMIKVKVIDESHEKDLEECINDCIADKEIIEEERRNKMIDP